MTAAPLHFHGERMMLDPSGAAFWPVERVLLVADLHFEKASAFARRGALLPPFDTRATLERLHGLMRRYQPAQVVALGDSFHDDDGCARLAKDDLARLEHLTRLAEFIWIAGNHDKLPHTMPGRAMAEHRAGPFVFRHQASGIANRKEVEISGHYHPKASIETRGKNVSRPCFVTDSTRLILPAFGALTGGLDVRDPAIAGLFPRGLRVFLLGQARLFSFSLGQLGRAVEPA